MEIISVHGEAGYIARTKSQNETQRVIILRRACQRLINIHGGRDIDGQEVQALSGQLSNRTSEDRRSFERRTMNLCFFNSQPKTEK